MSSAIEVLKARALPIEKIADAYLFGKEVHKGKMFVQVDWIDYDLKEAIVKLEKQEELKEWLEKEIELRKIKHDCIAKQAYKSSEDLFRIGELETEVTSLKEVLKRVGEQK